MTSPFFNRAAITIRNSLFSGVISAVILAIIDLYLTGHGYGSILREIITWELVNVHLSSGDLIVLIASVLSGYVTWHQSSHKT